MSEIAPSPQDKALRLNIDRGIYGVFAEIGAGQEVARWFFQAGHSAGSVAKTISAYDMTLSDALYGRASRYVSRQRLEAMLDREWGILLEGLDSRRGESSCFFVFADTVATRNADRQQDGHGWMGVRFQAQPRQAPSDILLHVNMRDRDRVHEHEALGTVGVNLIYAAHYELADPRRLLASLLDNLSRDRVEIDMVYCNGPAFAGVDNRILSLELVQQGFTDIALFTAGGEVVHAADALYKQPLLVERGNFRPLTNATLDLAECARRQFSASADLQGESPVVLMEMTLAGLGGDQGVDHQDFLARVDALGPVGNMVLISRHSRFFSLVEYLYCFTQRPICIALGLPTLLELTKEEHYPDLAGGMVESLGRLFKRNVRLLVYPTRGPDDGEPVRLESADVPLPARYLLRYLVATGRIEAIHGFDPSVLHIDPRDVLRRIQSGDSSWERDVPPAVAEVIRRKRLFGQA